MALDWSQCPAVESIPGKVSGAWVFRGTRLPVATIFENVAHDLAGCIDRKGTDERCVRAIDGGEGALVPQKAMGGAAAIAVATHDLAGCIDRTGTRGRRARGIDGGEGALVPQKAMEVPLLSL